MIQMQIRVIPFDVLQMFSFYARIDSHQESIPNCGRGVLEMNFRGFFRGIFEDKKSTFLRIMD